MNRSLVLLSGEGTSVPEAEARALFLAYDPKARFESPERRVLLVESETDPFVVASRIAFARRVGILIDRPREVEAKVRGKKVRLRNFDLTRGKAGVDPKSLLSGLEAEVDLEHPDYEFTLVRGERDYLALTAPGVMRQGWSNRRPRNRAFFHPSAVFPKLSRALVNLSRCREGELFLDPFAGTGSLPIEAAEIGAKVVASDQVDRMARGSLSNMKHLGQHWLAVLRADAFQHPLVRVDAIATDVPYGRASSTRGTRPSDIIERAISSLPSLLGKGSRLVLMHSQHEIVGGNRELALEEEHHLYVHKLLTRSITVLRRR